MPYHLAILHTVGPWGEGEGRSRARRKKTSRVTLMRGYIASKQQGSPFRTDYNKLGTLIEKVSSLLYLLAMPCLSK